jgi:hypothetical protein
MKKLFCLCLVLLSSACFGYSHKDTIYKTYKLKGGYTLEIKSVGNDSIGTVLVKGKDSNVLNSAETKLGLAVLGYVYADFDSTYIMMTHKDADPVLFELIDKASGQTIIYGQSPFYRDTIKQIMMFDGMYGKGRGKFVLYNFKTNHAEYFTAPTDTPCFCCFCWKLIELTNTEVKIQYENLKHEKVLKSYPRK